MQVLKTLSFLDDVHAVGGCVRDQIIGREFDDVDVATSTLPSEVMDRCESRGIVVKATGMDHGTVTAIISGDPIEITTFRKDVSTDGRRATVEFADSIETDLSRRDFTINAMAMDLDGNIVDPFDGQDDIENGIIKTVGRPERRFQEDLLRIVRGIRFASRFGFDFETETERAMNHFAPFIEQNVVVERMVMEIEKAFKDDDPERFIRLLRRFGVSRQFGLPRLSFGLNGVEPEFRMVALFAVPEMTEERLESLSLSNEQIDLILFSRNAIERILETEFPTDFEKRVFQFEAGERFEAVKAVLRGSMRTAGLSIEEWFEPVTMKTEPIVGGRHLIEEGFEPGPQFSEMIESCHDFQLRTGIEDVEILLEAVNSEW